MALGCATRLTGDPIGLGESTTYMFFMLVGQRPETIQKLAATSESKFCYFNHGNQTVLVFSEENMEFYLYKFPAESY